MALLDILIKLLKMKWVINAKCQKITFQKNLLGKFTSNKLFKVNREVKPQHIEC